MAETPPGPAGIRAPSAESLVFETGVAEKLKAYVYLLIDPRSDLVFYVGKGRGDRAYAHAREALGQPGQAHEGSLKMGTIRSIHQAGLQVRIEILHHGMTDAEAFLVESAAIDLLLHHGKVALGSSAASLSNLQRGHDTGLRIASVEELAARYAARQVAIQDRLILIRPSNLWWDAKDDHERYEATRKWWRVDVARRNRYGHAAAVVEGIIRMVWRIDRWEEDPKIRRAAFVGSRDPELESRYVWGDVSQYLAAGAQNPIRYVVPRGGSSSDIQVDEECAAGPIADRPEHPSLTAEGASKKRL